MTAISHNQIGQKLGRKGQETRERILAAVLRLLADPDGPPVTLAGVAKEASVRPPNLYLYFPDMGELVLAALARVMESAEDGYLGRLRQRWPDARLEDCCRDFLRAHYDFWRRHARLLHMRNAMADANDLRVLRYRNDVTLPLICLLAGQLGSGDAARDGNLACIMMTGLERVATVVTNPQFRILAGAILPREQEAYVQALIDAEAEMIAVTIAHRRRLAVQAPHLHSVASR